MDRLTALAAVVLLIPDGASWGQAPAGSGSASTAEPPAFVSGQAQPPDPTKPQTPPPQPPTPATAPAPAPTDPATRPARLGLSSRANWKAPMMGDFPGYYATGSLSTLTRLTVGTANQGRVLGTMTETARVGVPVLSRVGIKVAENESPIPQDRFFSTYNFYYRSAVPLLDRTATFTPAFPGTPTIAGAPVSDILVSPVSAHVLTAGFEKTFLDGRASVGLRVPFFFGNQTFAASPNPALIGGVFPGPVTGQTVGSSQSLGGSAIGDMTALFKVALFQNEETGNLFTAGLAVTVPTGQLTLPAGAADPDDVLLQPFVGYVLNADRFYLHAFHSVIVPTNPADVTLFANDVGIGFRWIERDDGALLTAVIPTVEAHVTTPLDHRDTSGSFYYTDVVVLTGGSHFVFGRSSVLTLGVATPVTGSRPFQVEAQVRFNWYY